MTYNNILENCSIAFNLDLELLPVSGGVNNNNNQNLFNSFYIIVLTSSMVNVDISSDEKNFVKTIINILLIIFNILLLDLLFKFRADIL